MWVKRGQCLQLTFSTLSRGGSVSSSHSALCQEGAVSVKRGQCLSRGGSVCSSHSALGPASHLKAECGGYA